MRTFHCYRYRPAAYKGLYKRLWHFHDRHPLPAPLNRAAREVLYHARRARLRLTTPAPRDGRDEFGDPVVPRQRYLPPAQPFQSVPLDLVRARFRELHAANEHLYSGDGSWIPHPRMPLYGAGVPIEEVSERILGYLAAHEAFGDPVYLERAEEGGRYLLERRLFADGHLRLEGHLVVELVYTYAGRALLALWERDRSASEYLDGATLIADRLLEEHYGGALDHVAKPAQLLAPLYRLTGREEYLAAALKRALRVVRFQLPYGGWPGDDARMWYHSIIARSVIDTYVATPNTLAHYAKKDRLARCVTAALNRVLAAQDEDGRIKIGRGDGTRDPLFAEYEDQFARICVRFTGSGFVPERLPLSDYVGVDQMDLLVGAFEELAVQPAAVAAHGYARVAVRAPAINRLEFETHLVGRYAQFLHRLSKTNPHLREKLGADGAREGLRTPLRAVGTD